MCPNRVSYPLERLFSLLLLLLQFLERHVASADACDISPACRLQEQGEEEEQEQAQVVVRPLA